jgi:phage shock protein PspC (stress-responsive transcriptional regulator)
MIFFIKIKVRSWHCMDHLTSDKLNINAQIYSIMTIYFFIMIIHVITYVIVIFHASSEEKPSRRGGGWWSWNLWTRWVDDGYMKGDVSLSTINIYGWRMLFMDVCSGRFWKLKIFLGWVTAHLTSLWHPTYENNLSHFNHKLIKLLWVICLVIICNKY